MTTGTIHMHPNDIIERYCKKGTRAHQILITHGQQVARKALQAARRVEALDPDLVFIEQAARLHDIGMIFTDTPQLGCRGDHPYICHGILGRSLLEHHHLPRHALVCERHVGTGIRVTDIHQQGLPLPMRDMQPVSIEEQIICFADKFYSKNSNGDGKEKSVDQIIDRLARYGEDKVRRFQHWVALFGS